MPDINHEDISIDALNTDNVRLERSAAGHIQAQQVEANDSQIGAIVAQDAVVDGSIAGAITGQEVKIDRSFVGILMAQRVEGNFQVLISTTGAVILGSMTIGAVILARMLQRD